MQLVSRNDCVAGGLKDTAAQPSGAADNYLTSALR